MDEHNQDDEKRRIMTPPPEWGGDTESPETDWLAETPPEPSAELDDSPSSALDGEVDWLGGDASDPAPTTAETDASASTKAVFTLPDDDAQGSGWLGNPDDTAAEPLVTEPLANGNSAPESASESELPPAPWGEDTTDNTTEAVNEDPVSADDTAINGDVTATLTDEQSAAEQADEAIRVRRVASKGREVDPQAVAAESLLTDHQAVESQGRRLPVWPFVTVTAAAILLIVGGWGAVQERNELQQEIAELKGQLGQKRGNGDLTASQEATLLAENESMKAQLATLRDEYAQLASEISSLQDRLMGSVEASGDEPTVLAVENDTPAAPEPAAPASPEPVVAAYEAPISEPVDNIAVLSGDNGPDNVARAGTTWFVNVASHSNRELAATWRDRIAERYDGVRIQEAEVNGRTLFRVRVLGFNTKDAADAARKQLEQAFGIGPLWVGSMTATANGITDAEVPTASREVPTANQEVPTASQEVPTAIKEPSQEAAPAPSVATTASPGSRVETAQLSSSPQAQTATQQPLELRPISDNGGWFIYVDTFSQSAAADERAKQITAAGYDAKVAVEYRAGEMFYRVQVVGITSRMQGETVVAELASLGDMPNLQLRQY